MKKTLEYKQRVLLLLSKIILLVGLGSAVAIYVSAEEAETSFGYEVRDGSLYANIPTKRFVHDLKMFGGEAAVMANDLRMWFLGLWQGKTLAYTVATLTIITAGIVYLLSVNLSDEYGERKE